MKKFWIIFAVKFLSAIGISLLIGELAGEKMLAFGVFTYVCVPLIMFSTDYSKG